MMPEGSANVSPNLQSNRQRTKGDCTIRKKNVLTGSDGLHGDVSFACRCYGCNLTFAVTHCTWYVLLGLAVWRLPVKLCWATDLAIFGRHFYKFKYTPYTTFGEQIVPQNRQTATVMARMFALRKRYASISMARLSLLKLQLGSIYSLGSITGKLIQNIRYRFDI